LGKLVSVIPPPRATHPPSQQRKEFPRLTKPDRTTTAILYEHADLRGEESDLVRPREDLELFRGEKGRAVRRSREPRRHPGNAIRLEPTPTS